MSLIHLQDVPRKMLGGKLRRYAVYRCRCGKEVELLCESVTRKARNVRWATASEQAFNR